MQRSRGVLRASIRVCGRARFVLAISLGTSDREPGPPASAFCGGGRVPLSGDATGNWNGWSPADSNSRFQSTQQAGLTVEQVRNLKLKWAFGFAGDVTAMGARSVLNGTVFMGSA